jgi:hypothetical protein
MPLTKTGREVLASMKKQYGAKKGKEVFYSSINKGKKGSSKWHKKSVRRRSKRGIRKRRKHA